jgi:hypothetical protein
MKPEISLLLCHPIKPPPSVASKEDSKLTLQMRLYSDIVMRTRERRIRLVEALPVISTLPGNLRQRLKCQGIKMARDLAIMVRRKLMMTDATERLEELRSPPGNRLEALRAIGPASTRSESTANGASCSSGETMARMKSRSWIITGSKGHGHGDTAADFP